MSPNLPRILTPEELDHQHLASEKFQGYHPCVSLLKSGNFGVYFPELPGVENFGNRVVRPEDLATTIPLFIVQRKEQLSRAQQIRPPKTKPAPVPVAPKSIEDLFATLTKGKKPIG